ncbi:hypothetical protein THAOC_16419 [Thalassiosira oceanica]|uniref:Rab-GAP TBC domain-containing protein n=1 Tax=Thalassiosira oceanica TaxID=159749 RepID=K0SXG7_THAOC|nr:hypothetical protein THAOC_16419 [Thalassiosira oceanica]|eukprot:EJK62952.1 hypothetical protein THAOC_16419 [Thalassiosira oceanica]
MKWKRFGSSGSSASIDAGDAKDLSDRWDEFDVESEGAYYSMNTHLSSAKRAGAAACTFLVEEKYASTREHALQIGRALACEFDLFVHEKNDFILEDSDKIKYKFIPAEKRVTNAIVEDLSSSSISDVFQEGLSTKTNVYKHRSYKRSFWGDDAVTFLCESNMAKSRQDGVRVAQMLIDKYGLFQHVERKHKIFKDKRELYRFLPRTNRTSDSEAFRETIPIEEWALRFKSVVLSNGPFSGTHAVDAMIDSDLAESRGEAVSLGDKLFSQLQLFECITGRIQAFLDRPDIYYKYCTETSILLPGLQWLGSEAIDESSAISANEKISDRQEQNSEPDLQVIVEGHTDNGNGRDTCFVNSPEILSPSGHSVITRSMTNHQSSSFRKSIKGAKFSAIDEMLCLNSILSDYCDLSSDDEDDGDDEREVIFDRFGFIVEDDARSRGKQGHAQVLSQPKESLSVRGWDDLLNSCRLTETGVTYDSVKHFMRLGLPDELRAKAWCCITGVDALVEEREGDYDSLVLVALRLMEEVSAEGGQSLKGVIERDLHRTFPKHLLFYKSRDGAGAEPARNIKRTSETSESSDPNTSHLNDGLSNDGLSALRSVYDDEIGYCQGMNFLAAMFLTFMNEEESFWLLVAVMNEEPYDMRVMYSEDMGGVHESLYIIGLDMEGILTYLRDELPNEIDGGAVVRLSTKIPLRQRQLKKLTAEWRGSSKRGQFVKRRLTVDSFDDSMNGSRMSIKLPKDLAKKLIPGARVIT